jgi:hypothetical protein
MKSFHRTRWSFAPWAKAGAVRAARIASIPPAAAAAIPAVLRNVRRSTGREATGLRGVVSGLGLSIARVLLDWGWRSGKSYRPEE